jgi:hypothetical protein
MIAEIRRVNINKTTRLEVEYLSEVGAIDNICLFVKDRMVGRAIIIPLDASRVLLLDIYVYSPDDRGKGYASTIMRSIVETYDHVVTSWLSAAGRDLCLKHGFELNGKVLTYQKKVEATNGGV